MTELKLQVSKTINAAPEKVFNAWLDPEMLARFMLPGPNTSVPSASSDATVGGRFAILMKSGDDEIPHAGTYKEIDPHSRIVFTWESPYSSDDSTVTLDFAPREGGTLITLTHVKFPSEDSRDNHEGGWTQILTVLADVLAA